VHLGFSEGVLTFSPLPHASSYSDWKHSAENLCQEFMPLHLFLIPENSRVPHRLFSFPQTLPPSTDTFLLCFLWLSVQMTYLVPAESAKKRFVRESSHVKSCFGTGPEE